MRVRRMIGKRCAGDCEGAAIGSRPPPLQSVPSAIFTDNQSPVSALSGPTSNEPFPSASELFLGGCYRTSKQVLVARKANSEAVATRSKWHKRCTLEVALRLWNLSVSKRP